jgi:pimeloyl-ACP methyl ester carboxylesterase
MENSAIIMGHGPRKVLALHGWFGSARSWTPLKAALNLDEFTYVFMDCRGYGNAIALEGEYSMAEVARDALALADRLDLASFSLVGHSMGGMAIQQLLLDAPRRVDKLVAITPVPACGVPFDAAAWELFSSAVQDAGARRTIIDMSTGGRLSTHWIDAKVRQSQRDSSAAAFGAYLPSWARTDISAAVAGNPVPVKVYVGAHDPGLNVPFMEQTWLRWYPNAQLEIIANAGHYPMDETPVALATSMEAFLRAPAARPDSSTRTGNQ